MILVLPKQAFTTAMARVREIDPHTTARRRLLEGWKSPFCRRLRRLFSPGGEIRIHRDETDTDSFNAVLENHFGPRRFTRPNRITCYSAIGGRRAVVPDKA